MQNIYYRLMQKSDIDSVIQCLSRAFTKEEPMTSFLKISVSDFSSFLRQICENIVEDNLSVVACFEEDNKIIGVRLSGIYNKEIVPLIVPDSMQAITTLLQQLYVEPNHFSQARCVHLKMLGVDTNFQNQGIAQKLLLKTLENAKARGYTYALVEATSRITQHIFMNKLQFQLLNKIHYQSFIHQQHPIFASLQNETHCALLGKSLYE